MKTAKTKIAASKMSTVQRTAPHEIENVTVECKENGGEVIIPPEFKNGDEKIPPKNKNGKAKVLSAKGNTKTEKYYQEQKQEQHSGTIL